MYTTNIKGLKDKMQLNFEPVTEENRSTIEALHPSLKQINFIESVKECMLEADDYAGWKPYGVYDNETLVGFVMYGYFNDPAPKGRLWLDRILIDEKYQGHGYGEELVNQMLKRLPKEYPNMDEITLSVYDNNPCAIHVYEKAGFRFNGELDTKGEKIMTYKIHR